MKGSLEQSEFTRYRHIYEKNLEERFIQKNFEHPSPRFFLNKGAPSNFETNRSIHAFQHPMPSISSIPKASIDRVTDDIKQHPSIYKVTNLTPSPSPDIPDSLKNVARLREMKMADFIDYQMHQKNAIPAANKPIMKIVENTWVNSPN